MSIDRIRATFQASIEAKQALLADETRLEALLAAANLASSILAGGHKIMLCGNGGSAADSQHIAAELIGRFERERAPIEGADCLMITLNAEMQEERALLDESAAFNAGILVKKVFGSGYLAHDPKKQLLTLLSHPNVTSAIIGTLNPEHLRHNCESLLVGINP